MTARRSGSPALPRARVDAVRALVTATLQETGTPGMAVAITDGQRTLFDEGFGLGDVSAGKPVTAATLFEIGSIGKSFTAFCLVALADEGRLSLDDPVERHLPWWEVPGVGAPITLHHLLSHTGGIVSGIDATPEPAFQVWALRELAPGSPPGERFHYSNVGYKALGLVLEAVERRSYPEIVRRRILEPLGMTATEPAITNGVRPRLAVGYAPLHDDRIAHALSPLVPATWLETATADGSIASTAGDMAHHARLLLGRGAVDGARVVADESFRRMVGPHATMAGGAGYGYGLAARTVGDRTFLGHGGGMVGYLASVQVDAAAGLGVVVLQNGYGAAPVRLSRDILSIAADGPAAMGATPAASGTEDDDRATRESPVGDWVSEPSVAAPRFSIIADGSCLLARGNGFEAVLEPWAADRWLVPHERFDRHLLWLDRGTGDDDGQPAVLWHGGVAYARAGRSRRLRAASPEVAACAGTYRSHTPWTTNFDVVVREDRLWLTFASVPDGFDDEAPLVPLGGDVFRVGEDATGPERVAFDTRIDGRPVRALLSGWPYFRTR